MHQFWSQCCISSGGQELVFIYEGFLSAPATGEYIASEEFVATPATMSEMINASTTSL